MTEAQQPELTKKNGNGLVIALDAMGGDNAPESVLKAADAFIKKNSDVRFLIFGDKQKIAPILEKLKSLPRKSEVWHTDEAIADDEKPSSALRRGRNSSMFLAIKSIKDGQAHAAVSGGNTGALMALSKYSLQTLPGIDRPAIGGLMPTRDGYSVMLDLGANIHCDAENLFEFTIMGTAFAKSVLGKEHPSVGLLNVGSEKNKGHDVLRGTVALIEESGLNINYHGYIEGNDLLTGMVDVIVTDGFTGNVALKTVEGTAKFFSHKLKDGMKKSPLGLLGMGIAAPALLKVKKKTDPRMYNGAMFLGLNGIVVKSHGGSDHIGFKSAIEVSYKLAKNKINDHIVTEMISYGQVPMDDVIDIEDSISLD